MTSQERLQQWENVSILQTCLHEPIHTQRHFKVNVRKADYKIKGLDTTNFCTPKKQTLQNSIASKSRHYKLLQSQKADITKFCSLKKRTLQTFVVQKSRYHKILQSQTVDTTNFSNGWPRQIYVNKMSKMHTFGGFACAALLWIKFLKPKMEYGSCNISLHSPTISPSDICLEQMDAAG